MRLKLVMAATLVAVASSASALAQEPLVFELPQQGIRIEMNGDGQWNKIYSTGVQPVDFPDRRGISSAQKIAEQRAKAEIVKFFDQSVSTETIFNEMEVSEQSSARQQGDTGSSFSKDSKRRLATSISETQKSFSRGNLRGVMILESGYDEKNEEAWVKVGISRNSIAMASGVQDMVANRGLGGASSTSPGTADEIRRPPSEVRSGSPLP